MRQTSETTDAEVEQNLRALHRDVMILVAELSYTGPSLPLKVELATRRRALSAFWQAWLPFSRVGYPTKDRLDELEFAVREPLWLAKFATVDQAVRYLCHAVRSRSKEIDHLPLMPELLPAAAQAEDVLEVLPPLEGPCRAYLAARLAGETWEEAGAELGHDQATMRRHRDKIRKDLVELRSSRPAQPKRVRERLKRRR